MLSGKFVIPPKNENLPLNQASRRVQNFRAFLQDVWIYENGFVKKLTDIGFRMVFTKDKGFAINQLLVQMYIRLDTRTIVFVTDYHASVFICRTADLLRRSSDFTTLGGVG